ncbi:unnamed protein product [Gadus morhua 'NCC']
MSFREASLSILQLRIIRAGQHPVYSPVNAAINLTWEVDFGNHPLTDIHLNYRIDFRHHLASVIYFFRGLTSGTTSPLPLVWVSSPSPIGKKFTGSSRFRWTTFSLSEATSLIL